MITSPTPLALIYVKKNHGSVQSFARCLEPVGDDGLTV